ncbi:hypothetical protein BJ508DRAFT_413484 [Ascobolus immersus RN42]|uniref:Stress-associated endoplasmic reticulum protein n=1 Tax=Ascobolus immersus RN42 TaxID=1160509 RepID=A0A3N4IB21_ASCIM|nr:hypothetical protein BJ508DRAFT_413484 [Ascobolus immersus RN42]
MPSHLTPQMRAANAKFAKKQELKRGRSSTELKEKVQKRDYKLPVSVGWIYLLGFVLIGGGIFEVLRMML